MSRPAEVGHGDEKNRMQAGKRENGKYYRMLTRS
jgi:hypothetical protein